MGWGVFQHPQKETNSDTIITPSLQSAATNPLSSLSPLSSTSSTSSATTKLPKRDSSIWFPFNLDNSDLCKTNVHEPHHSTITNKELAECSKILTEFSTPPLPVTSCTLNEKKTAHLYPALSSCRYYPTTDKQESFLPYASNIVSENVSPRPSSAVHQFSALTDVLTATHHHHHNAQQYQQTSHHHHHLHHHHHNQQQQQQQQSQPTISHATQSMTQQSLAPTNCGIGNNNITTTNLFGSPFSSVSTYPLLQNIPYEATVGTNNARCALPSPTIFPPTPPPSAPWNPWAGF